MERNPKPPKYWLRYVITFGLGLILAISSAAGRGVFAETRLYRVYHLLCDASFLVAAIYIGLGLLLIIGKEGVFNMLGYSMQTLKQIFTFAPVEAKKDSYFEYVEQRRARKKESIWFIPLTGLVFLAIAVIFLMLYNNVQPF